MKLVKYIKNPYLILLKLDKSGIIKLPDKLFIQLRYKEIFNKKINLRKPKTFNEKIQWLKLYDRNPDYVKMVDKIAAKDYVSSIIGKEYIIPTIGIYNKFEDIDFSKLPNQFVIKCNHDSGNVIICNNKSNLDIEEVRKKINKSLKYNFYKRGREWPYKYIKPQIIIEKFLYNENNDSQLRDYKFFCFNGKPKFMYVSEGLENHKTAKIDFVDMQFKRTPFGRSDFQKFNTLPPKPRKFMEMKKIAKILSKDIPFVRVDLYEVNNTIYFSELTFFPGGGFIRFTPKEWDYKIGKLLNLSMVKRNEK